MLAACWMIERVVKIDLARSKVTAGRDQHIHGHAARHATIDANEGAC
jgi:hypothetical protein